MASGSNKSSLRIEAAWSSSSANANRKSTSPTGSVPVSPRSSFITNPSCSAKEMINLPTCHLFSAARAFIALPSCAGEMSEFVCKNN